MRLFIDLFNAILITVGVYTSLKWISWNVIDKTKIVESIGNFLTRSNDDKNYYFASCNRVFEAVKYITIILWIVIPIIMMFVFGMKTIV